jgi:hypothetical protein
MTSNAGARSAIRRHWVPLSGLIAFVIVERNTGVRLEARFALAAVHPDHDAYERGDKDKKVDCLNHVTYLAISIVDRLLTHKKLHLR